MMPFSLGFGSQAALADGVGASSRSKKRPRSVSARPSAAGAEDVPSSAAMTPRTASPLSGLCICLSGFSPEEKEEYFALVEKCGGSYTRDLHIDGAKRTTHLIVTSAHGEKYENAIRCAPHTIEILRPQWLVDCAVRDSLLDVANYRHSTSITVDEHMREDEDGYGDDEDNEEDGDGDDICVGEGLDSLLASLSDGQSPPMVPIFSRCQFYLAGFDSGTEGEDKENGTAILKAKMSRLVRRERGTILWDIDENVSHIVVADDCNDSIRRAAVSFALQLQGPVVVAPRWILASCRARQLQPPFRYQPRARKVHPPPPTQSQSQPEAPQSRLNQARTASEAQPDQVNASQRKKARPSNRQSSNALFKGAIFAFVRPTPPEWAVDWSNADYEKKVRDHGGVVLNQAILNALRNVAGDSFEDFRSSSRPEGAQLTDKVCYLVSSGGYPQNQNSAFHPLIGEVMNEKLCTVVLVTPLWVDTCIAEKRDLSANSYPYLFQPQAYHVRRLPPSVQIKVSISGFVGGERAGIRNLLNSIGATYTDNLSKTNSHLISKNAAGPKYQKALEWGLKVVTLDWLRHIVRYGFGGENGADQTYIGCEHYFSLEGNREVTRQALRPQHGTTIQETTQSTTVESVIAASWSTQASAGQDRELHMNTDTIDAGTEGGSSSKTTQESVAASHASSGQEDQEQQNYADDVSPAKKDTGSIRGMECCAAAGRHRGGGQDQPNNTREVGKGQDGPNDAGKVTTPGERSTCSKTKTMPMAGPRDTIDGENTPRNDGSPVVIKGFDVSVRPEPSDVELQEAGIDGRGNRLRLSPTNVEAELTTENANAETPVPIKQEFEGEPLQSRSSSSPEKKTHQNSGESQIVWYGDFTQQQQQHQHQE